MQNHSRWRARRRLRRGYCPACNSSPPLPACPVCYGDPKYGTAASDFKRDLWRQNFARGLERDARRR